MTEGERPVDFRSKLLDVIVAIIEVVLLDVFVDSKRAEQALDDGFAAFAPSAGLGLGAFDAAKPAHPKTNGLMAIHILKLIFSLQSLLRIRTFRQAREL